jgi:hypothetical protein
LIQPSYKLYKLDIKYEASPYGENHINNISRALIIIV